MASIIFCEAGNQPYEGQVAVGAVIMNRVRSSAYPNSIEAVIYQAGQFGPASTGWLDRVRSSRGYTATALFPLNMYILEFSRSNRLSKQVCDG